MTRNEFIEKIAEAKSEVDEIERKFTNGDYGIDSKESIDELFGQVDSAADSLQNIASLLEEMRLEMDDEDEDEDDDEEQRQKDAEEIE